MLEPNPALMSFNGKRFNSVELDGEFWIRADELGLAIGLEQPEQAVLQLYQDNPGQFSERLTALVGVETQEGPRMMRAFNLLGAYVLCTFVDTYAARSVRRWLLETIIYFQMDVKREIKRLIAECKRLNEVDEALRADIEALKAAMRQWEMKGKGDAEARPEWFEGEFRRLFEEQMSAFRDMLAAIISEHLARLPASPDAGRDGLENLAEAIAGLYERIDGAAPSRQSIARLPPRPEAAGIPVPAAPSDHWLYFRYEGKPVSVLLENGNGPWFIAKEITAILGCRDDCLPLMLVEEDEGAYLRSGDWRSFEFEDGETCYMVNEEGLCDLFEYDLGTRADRTRLTQWLQESLIPSVEMLILREDEALRVKGDPEWQPPPSTPRRLVADGLFPVYSGKISGRTCMMVNARELYKYLEIRKPFVEWLPRWLKRLGTNEGHTYLRVLVQGRYYDYYLDLEVTFSLLFHERHPKAREAYDFLISVINPHGGVIEGESEVVGERAASPEGREISEGKLVSVPFHKQSLPSFQRDGEIYVAMKPIVEGMGLAWHGQFERIKRNEILSEGIRVIRTPSAGGEQEMVSLPLKLLNGWLFGIDTKRVKPEIREVILTYQRESYDVLYRYWHSIEQPQRQPAHPAHTQKAAHLADTPPAAPLTFEHEGKRLRVAIQGGQPWFYAQDLHDASHTKYETSHWNFSGVPPQWRALLPGAGGKGNVPALSVPGMAHYFGHNTKLLGNPLFEYILGEVLPSINQRLGATPVAPVPAIESKALPPIPPGKLYTQPDALYVAFTDIMQRRLKANRQRIAILNCSMLLTHLWRNGGDGQWLDVRKPGKLTLSKTLGISPRSLGRSLDVLVANGFVERTPALDSRCPEIWPHNIRLLPENILAALAEAGLDLPEELGAAG